MNIWTIIVTYNSQDFIKKCLNSLFSSSIETNIVVIDNDSSDQTLQILKSFEQIKIIEQSQNIGFGRANNLGIEYAIEQGAESIFLLNQDAWIDKNMFEKMIPVLLENKDYGIIGPIQMNEGWINIEAIFKTYLSNNSQLLADFDSNELAELYEVDFINAAGWFVKAELFEKLGGFDPLFFMYGEDEDFIQRLKYFGYKVGVAPQARLVHARINSSPISKKVVSKRALIKKRILKYGVQIKCATKDVNKDFDAQSIYFIKDLKRKILRSILYFQFNRYLLYRREYRLFKACLADLKKSHELNKTTGAHFLSL